MSTPEQEQEQALQAKIEAVVAKQLPCENEGVEPGESGQREGRE